MNRLVSWYRQGADVQRLLPALSTWLGHAHLDGTQVYLSMTPELLHAASVRFERHVDLEDDRGCSVQTRNQRLTAIRALARFVASRDPGHLEWSANIRAIALKKTTPQPIGWLSKDEMQALLEVPDRRTPRGRIEHALLLFLYNTGARVSEATELVASDLQVGRRDGRHALVTIHGKGGKHRQCPLWPRTERALAELVHRACGATVSRTPSAPRTFITVPMRGSRSPDAPPATSPPSRPPTPDRLATGSAAWTRSSR